MDDDLQTVIDAPIKAQALATSTHHATRQVLSHLAELAQRTTDSDHVARALLAQHHTPDAVLSYLHAAQLGVSQILATWALATRNTKTDPNAPHQI